MHLGAYPEVSLRFSTEGREGFAGRHLSLFWQEEGGTDVCMAFPKENTSSRLSTEVKSCWMGLTPG